MTSPEAGRPGTGQAAAGWGLAALALGYAAWLHHGLGPPGEGPDPPWWRPRGFLTEQLASTPFATAVQDPAVGIPLFAIPSALLLVLVVWLARSPLARALAATSFVAVLLFSFYGVAGTPRFIWDFFHWRGSVTMIGVAAAVGFAATSPWLAASWLRLRWPLRLLLYLPVFLAVIGLVRNTTGTNPSLPFSVSPWPAIAVFGLELGAAAFAAQFAGIALGLLGFIAMRRGGRARAAGFVLLGFGVLFPALSLWAGDRVGLLPFRVDSTRLALAAAVCLAGIGLAAAMRDGRHPSVWKRRALHIGTGALLVGAPLLLAQTLAFRDYTVTREQRAGAVIDALANYFEREGVYPETLDALVESGELKTIPRPRIGFRFLDGQRFVYQGFGTGYILEFSAPRWVQCTYSPPWTEEDEEFGALDDPDAPGEDGFEEEPEQEPWTCPSKPPELW